MATFVNTVNPTPRATFDQDGAFVADADKVVTYVKQRLGDEVVTVEMTNKQVWTNFEASALEYSKVINSYQAKSIMGSVFGSPTGSLTSGSATPGPHGQEQRVPNATFEFVNKFASAYGREAGIGGNTDVMSGSITLMTGTQYYDLDGLLSGSATSSYGTRWDGSKLKIHEIFHFEPAAAFRFFDSTTAINYLNNEFTFESFTPETVFYVLPIYEDILRGMQLKLSQRVRRSMYSFEIINNKLRIFPEPTTQKKLWIRFQKRPDPYDEDTKTGQLEGVSNIANIPFGVIEYKKLNSIARQWIHEYTLAMCMETLGRIRGKFGTIPIPNAEVTLDGDTLITQGIEKQNMLKTELTELLDSMTYDKIMEQQAMVAENINKSLRYTPFAKPIFYY